MNNNSNSKLTVLLAPGAYVGPMMSAIGIGEVLRDSGHYRVVFAVMGDWREKLVKLNFEVELIGEEQEVVRDSMEVGVEYDLGLINNDSPLDKLIKTSQSGGSYISVLEAAEPYYRAIIDRIRPDCIISDHVTMSPTIINYSRCLKVFYHSNNPLGLDMIIHDTRLPPSKLGLSLNSDKQLWEEYRSQLTKAKKQGFNSWNSWLQSHGCPPLEDNLFFYASPDANFYLTPKELDYTDIRPLPDNYYQFDYFKRTANDDVFELPEQLKHKSGKLVYLSLGSIGSAHIYLMKRLVGMLAKSEHRFIVSKGLKHDKYELADNMWGEKFVPQVKVLPIVDLFITHGGNNSITECMYFGKPMIVLPLFMDQFDNAQIVEDRGYGIRLNPFECTEQQLLQSIDKLLNDTKLAEKLAKTSHRIQTEKQIEKIPEIIDRLVKNKK
ncbi:oleandomycin glycosyltransferase-like [Oppia nitens]|uniref:oleandomycin glycosyltransferase-like n=1 Tax=Oppia nitens TaxID=1686743 RepID=UPI0023DB282D|nr:oleandomycin glycosyltransferase-like [Oppia nitens]